MEQTPYSRVLEEDGRTPMLWNRDHGHAEDLSMSMLNGFDAVLNAREEKINPDALPPEPDLPGSDRSDAYFWSSNPNHSILLIHDLKHKGQVYVDDMSTRSISWDKLMRRWLVASLLLPAYIVYSLRIQASPPGSRVRPGRVWRIAVFAVGTFYWLVLFLSSIVYFIWPDPDISLTEVLLPLVLHFFVFFVEALLCSVELTNGSDFDDSADRIMCKMQVTGTSYAWHETMDVGFLPPELRTSAAGGGDVDTDDISESQESVDNSAAQTVRSESLEKENIVTPNGMPQASGQALLKDLVNLILARQDHLKSKESRWLILTTILCSVFYACLPQIMRLASKIVYAKAHGFSFWLVSLSLMVTNFILCLVVLDALSKSLSQLKFRLGIAKSFTQLTSKSAASMLGMFHFELQTIENLWGWLTLRSYLLRRGKKPQARVEVILSASFAFLVPLSLMLALDFIFSKTPVTIFIVSSFVFCFMVASYLLMCVWSGVQIQATYKDPDVLLSEQLAIHYRICTTRDAELHRRLNDLHKAIAKIMEILQRSAGSGVVMNILGFTIDENFARVLVGGLLSLASAGFSSIIRYAVGGA